MENIKGIGVIAIIFIVVVMAAVYDIFNVNPGGLDGTSVWPAVVYGGIGFALIAFAYRYFNKRKV